MPDEAGTTEAILAAEASRFAAMLGRDVEGLARVLADDLVFVHRPTGVVESKASLLAPLRAGRLVYTALEPKDLRVRRFGEAAVITGDAFYDLVIDGVAQQFAMRYTGVWSWRDGRWQMVSFHSTTLA